MLHFSGRPFFWSSPEFRKKSVLFLVKTFFLGLHLICSPEHNRGRGSSPILKRGQNWGKIANYPLQCSTKIATPAVLYVTCACFYCVETFGFCYMQHTIYSRHFAKGNTVSFSILTLRENPVFMRLCCQTMT